MKATTIAINLVPFVVIVSMLGLVSRWWWRRQTAKLTPRRSTTTVASYGRRWCFSPPDHQPNRAGISRR
jgi:hypothetical protein